MARISIVIPTYNRPEGLTRVLDSLQEQTEKDFDLIVVEDGSKVGEEIVRDYTPKFKSVHYYWQGNAGPAKSRNRGIKEAKTNLIAFTDDDMKLPPDWVEKLLDGFRRYPEVAGVGGYMKAPEEVFRNSKFAQYEWFVSHDIYQAGSKERVGGFENPAGGTNNLAFKKKVLNEVGGFDEHFPVPAGEDADLKKRITDLGYKLLYLPLKADHYQPYGLKRFIRQSYVRGIGTYYFVNKHEGALTKKVIYSRFVAVPVRLVKDLLSEQTRRYAFIRLLENYNVARGLLHALKKSA